MNIHEYISKNEVQRVCQELGLSDWAVLESASVPMADVIKIQEFVSGEALEVTPEIFKMGLEIELEHGLAFPDANVTNNHPVLTGMIVLAHLKEMLDYYERLEIAEIEGDIFKAVLSGDSNKILQKNKLLVVARAALFEKEQRNLKQI